MLQKMKTDVFKETWSKIPITFKVTSWYTFFISILFYTIMVSSIFISDYLVSNVSNKNLMKSVEKMADNIENFEEFENGVFFSVFDMTTGRRMGGKFPHHFSLTSPFSIDTVTTYKEENETFIYYDSIIEGTSLLVRGIFPISKLQSLLNWLTLVIFISAPILLFLIIYGGYKIIKNAFKPVEIISETALEIQKSRNFSKRIELNNGNDEIHKMAYSFNKILDTLEETFIHEKQFNSDVSHELRTPITVIFAESDYALTYADTLEEAKESLNVIKRQSQKMCNLINQIMELAKLESQKELKTEEINLSNLINQIINDYKIFIEEKNIKLKNNIEKDTLISGNKLMLERVFDNLLNNAIKFTKDSIFINLYKKNSFAYLEIKDNGSGLTNEEQKRIWNRFYQTNSSRNKEKNSGIGLGLSMVQKIIELHNAEIYVESKIEKGSNFISKFKLLK